jgi:hypothetical protein
MGWIRLKSAAPNDQTVSNSPLSTLVVKRMRSTFCERLIKSHHFVEGNR